MTISYVDDNATYGHQWSQDYQNTGADIADMKKCVAYESFPAVSNPVYATIN